jgi:hypothetical protein
VRFAFRRQIRHPFYPALKPAPAAAAKAGSPALYGAVEDLATAALGGARPARAVFPLLGPAMPFLEELQRERLWACFQVPIYALLVDGRENVVGYECEAQGLHLRDNYAATLLFGRVEFEPCECGRPGPRLVREEPRMDTNGGGVE